jgi:hypothetical protein
MLPKPRLRHVPVIDFIKTTASSATVLSVSLAHLATGVLATVHMYFRLPKDGNARFLFIDLRG